MPIEINELHIKVSVNESSGHSGSNRTVVAEWQSKREILLTECMEQINQILKRKKER